MKLPLRTALVASHLLVLALPVAVLAGSHALGRELIGQRQEELQRQAAALAIFGEERISDRALAEAFDSATLRAFRDATHCGVRVVDRDGRIVATNGPRLGDSVADRPEVMRALSGQTSVAARTQVPPTAERKAARTWAYAAAPLRREGEVVGAVLLTRPSRRPTQVFSSMAADLSTPAAIAAVATLALALWLGERLSRSLRSLAEVADGVAEGRVDGATLERVARTRVREVGFLARAFSTMTERLDARMRHNHQFASNVSHEFRTPLTTLRGTVEVLADDLDMPAEQRVRFRDNARTDIDRLSAMVEGLLSLARVEEPREHVPVDVDALVADVVARFDAVTVAGRAGTRRADAAQLDLALSNVLQNAVDHGAPPISVHLSPEGIEVRDAGRISEANLPRVFDRFFTAARERRGTGLGLSIVRAVCRAHGGDATVASGPGGTVVRLGWATP